MDPRLVPSLVLPLAFLTVSVCLRPSPASAQDFNGDSIHDMVVGVPYEGVDDGGRGRTAAEAGAVDVVYGTPSNGVTPLSQHWTLASEGIPGSPQTGDHFGFAVAWGLFNNDGYWDVAVGIPGRDVDGIEDAGSVLIIYGSKEGLSASGPLMAAAPRLLRQGAGDVPGIPLRGDNFGYALASSYAWTSHLPQMSEYRSYLAIGAPGVTAGEAGGQGRGEVVVIYPFPGINQLWQQIGNAAKPGDWFGFSLASGNFGGRSKTPDASGDQGLAIGVPGEDVDGVVDAGAVEVLYQSGTQGLPHRLDAAGAQIHTQQGLGETPQSRAMFGFSLAAGGLTGREYGEGRDELAIGEPFRDVGFGHAAGAVHVLRGDLAIGLDASSVRTITQGGWVQGWPLPSTAEDGDWFGFSLTIAQDDLLAIGSPGENNGDGSVHILHGGPNGVTSSGAQLMHAPAGLRQFGWSLSAWGWRLLVGAPRTNGSAGAVVGFRRTDAGAFETAGFPLTQDSVFGAAEPSESGDGFGFSVGAGGLPWINFTP